MNNGGIKLEENKKISKKTSIITIALILALTIFGAVCYYAYKETEQYKTAMENKYNMAFYELVDYIQNVEVYLAKSLISTSPEHGAENLTNVWREASLAQSQLAQLPLSSNELENASKFLNQVSDYSYSLSRKNMSGEGLSEEDLNNIKELHQYSVDLENTINQLSTDLYNGRIKWSDLNNTNPTAGFATEVSSITQDSFSSLEENFHEYAGLIYDGAFSEHLTSNEKKGLTGEEIDEEQAKKIVEQFYGQQNISEIISNGYSENADIPSYDFNVRIKDTNTATISISKQGGHIIFANYNKNVNTELITQEQADEIGKNFLEQHGYTNMKETYYYKQSGIVTINYAYYQTASDGKQVVMYPDLIKLKLALDDGSVLGIETSGYLNCHYEREIPTNIISKDEAKKILNSDLEIISENLAIIPTEWQTEILCWEFKGKVEDNEFLVYINAQTGKEEDILVIVNTPNGTLTH